MIINPTFLIKDPEIIKGLLDGTLKRHGGVIRDIATGRIKYHLVESTGLTNNLMTLTANPILGSANLVTNAIGHGISINKLNEIQRVLPSILQMSQISAGASVLNLGISAVGFAYMGYKLHKIQTALGKMQQSMEAGFNNIKERLDVLSGQLAYLHLLVQENRQEQIKLADAINQLHRTILIKEIAQLRAELIAKDRFADTSIQPVLKVASKVRMIMSDQALQISPELEPHKMLLAGVATQGWAVATATETHLLLELGMFEAAEELLNLEIPRFQQNAQLWTDNLLKTERPEINTAYRFTAPLFQQHISQERVNRIINISSSDRNLPLDKKQEKQDDIAVEFQMSYTSQFDQNWVYRQVAIAEYLDTFSELSARLETLKDLTTLCQKTGVKSSLELLPKTQDDQNWYILPS
ncbi:hypothetical protein NIES4102_26000 [Chondrocystis sp. NIES-4102]|nr:hypothetical protein NIES4102_26000 [Chondrocystis sp. NIES-4102]